MEFEWDSAKAESNLRKHEVPFDEAETVFGDPYAVTFDDPDHSDEEPRYIIFGHSLRARLLTVCYTERRGKIRIISARRSAPWERRVYGQGQE